MRKIIITLLLIIWVFPTSIYADQDDYYKAPIDILTMSIGEIQKAVSQGYITYEGITRLYLDRIKEYDSKYNSIISVNEKALEEAKEKDLEYKKTGVRSLLHGIPIVIKDNLDFVGLPTTGGSKALNKNFPIKNSDVVQKLIDAGAIILAKTNMSEFAFSASNSLSSYGFVYNAYNNSYTSYGSSGGTAVAVAAGFAVAGIGTDTNSSIRTPASANNLVGLRPTISLVSNKGVLPYDLERDVVGPITKHVSDAFIILNIINQQNKEYKLEHKDTLKGYKVGVLTQLMQENSTSNIRALKSTYKEIVNLMNSSISVLESLGAEIVYIDDFYSSYYENIYQTTLTGILFCYGFNQYIKGTNGPIKSFDDLLNSRGYIQDISGYNSYCYSDYRNTQDFKKKEAKKKEYREYVTEVFKNNDIDVLIYPTTKSKLMTRSESLIGLAPSNSYVIAPTTGFPSINVPIGFDMDNLPYGMEMLALPYEENILYQISSLYEKETNYYRLPDLVPSLYETNEVVNNLINYYEKYQNNKRFLEVVNENKEFFEEYNYNNEPEATAQVLIDKYKETEVKLQTQEKMAKSLLLVSLIGIVIVLLLIKLRINKNKIKKYKKVLKR